MYQGSPYRHAIPAKVACIIAREMVAGMLILPAPERVRERIAAVRDILLRLSAA